MPDLLVDAAIVHFFENILAFFNGTFENIHFLGVLLKYFILIADSLLFLFYPLFIRSLLSCFSVNLENVGGALHWTFKFGTL